MKTYKRFLDELEMYGVGAEIELSFYEWSENLINYQQAAADGYIMIVDKCARIFMHVLQKPENWIKICETYFG